ncbi:MAG: 50S ribosomal protein L21 [bacterium]
MKYAIAVIGGAQVKLEEGKTYKFDRFDGQITNVVFYKDDEVEKVGAPTVAGVKVVTEKIEDKNDKKVQIRRYRAKSRYRKVRGHRQPVSLVKVKSLSFK